MLIWLSNLGMGASFAAFLSMPFVARIKQDVDFNAELGITQSFTAAVEQAVGFDANVMQGSSFVARIRRRVSWETELQWP